MHAVVRLIEETLPSRHWIEVLCKRDVDKEEDWRLTSAFRDLGTGALQSFFAARNRLERLMQFKLIERSLKQLKGEQVEKERRLKNAEEQILNKPKAHEEGKEIQDSLERYNRLARITHEVYALKTIQEQSLNLKKTQMAKASMKKKLRQP